VRKPRQVELFNPVLCMRCHNEFREIIFLIRQLTHYQCQCCQFRFIFATFYRCSRFLQLLGVLF